MTAQFKPDGFARWDLKDLTGIASPEEFQARCAKLRARAVGATPAAEEGLMGEGLVAATLQLETIQAELEGFGAYYYAALEEPFPKAVKDANGASFFAAFDAVDALETAVQKGLAALSEEQFAALATSESLGAFEHRITLLRQKGLHEPSPEAADAVNALYAVGERAMATLYINVSQDVMVDAETSDGKISTHSLGAYPGLMSDPDPRVRQSSFWNCRAAWQEHEKTAAQCLSSIAGSRLAQWKAEGYDDFLDPVMLQNDVARETVEHMIHALFEHRGIAQDYLKVKAKLLGLPELGIYDRTAPISDPRFENIGFDKAHHWITEAFGMYHPGMKDYVACAYAANCVETEARPTKFYSGYTVRSHETRSAGISSIFAGSYGQLQIFAHEICHGFHFDRMFGNSFWNTTASNTACETQAILGEILLRNYLLKAEKSPETARYIGAAQFDAVVNNLIRIPRDFTFENALYKARKEGDLSGEDIARLHSQEHKSWFGDALCYAEQDEEARRGDGGDAYGWIYREKFFLDRTYFYNFSYTMAFIIAEAIGQRFEAEGPAFAEPYDKYLGMTGKMSTEDAVLQGLGINLRDDAFWTETMNGVAAKLKAFKEQVKLDD